MSPLFSLGLGVVGSGYLTDRIPNLNFPGLDCAYKQPAQSFRSMGLCIDHLKCIFAISALEFFAAGMWNICDFKGSGADL